jgi:hypothetical protein
MVKIITTVIRKDGKEYSLLFYGMGKTGGPLHYAGFKTKKEAKEFRSNYINVANKERPGKYVFSMASCS